MKNLRGKIALITGASRGLGPHIAMALAREGADVALMARTSAALEATAAEVGGHGVRTAVISGDVTDGDARVRVVDRVRAELGEVDILVNNAGIERISSYTSLSPKYVQAMIETNLVAPLLLARLLLPRMLERGSGHILAIASLGGKKGSPFSATYAATKAGLIEWTAGLREELHGTGVSASVISPGFVAEVGIFAAYGKRAPRLAGETTPRKVAEAVIRAIKDDVGEIIVNPGPVRLLLVANAVSPALASWVLRAAGVYEFFRQQARDNEASSSCE